MRGLRGNVLASYGRFLVVMAVQFALTPVILHAVGAEDFGLWSLTFAVMGFLGLLDGGLATSAVKFIAECRGSGDTERRNTIASTLLALYLGLAALATLAVFVLSLGYVHWFHLPEAKASVALALLWLLALRSVIFALPLSLFHSLLFGEQKNALLSAVQAGATLIYALAVWGALQLGAGIILVAAINLAAMLAEYGVYALLVRRVVPGLRLSLGRAQAAELKTLAGFSGAQLLVNIAQLVRLRTDPILVQLFCGLEPVAAYAVALRIAESALLLIKQAVNVLAPVIAQLHGAGETQKIKALFVRGSKLVLAGASVLSVALACLASEIVGLWVGPSLRDAVRPLVILLAAMALATPQLVGALVLVMTGQHAFSARAQTLGMVLNVAASVVLVRAVGPVGVALGTLVATIVVDVATVLPRACRSVEVGVGSFARQVFAPSLVCGAVQAGVTLGLRGLLPAPTHLLGLLPLALPGAVLFAALFLVAFTPPAERRWRKKK
jgi:O-antigen/teichoic acid export membrane protein